MIGRFVFPVLIRTGAHVGVISVQGRQVQRRDVEEYKIAPSAGVEPVQCHKHAVREIGKRLPGYLAVCQKRVIA